MGLDVLALGPFIFDDFATPEKLPLGGRQKMVVHRMPGGSRVIDCMGPDDIDRGWSGTMWGQNAAGDAALLDALRKSGEALPYVNGYEARTVVILEFLYFIRKATCVDYSIILTLADSSAGGGFGGGFGGLDQIIGLDLDAVVGLLQ